MSQHIFEPEKESSWRAYQESVFSDTEFSGYEPLLKIRMSGRMTSRAEVGLRTQSFDKAYDTLPLQNAVPEYDLPHVSIGNLPATGQEGDFNIDLVNQELSRYTAGGWVLIPENIVFGVGTPVNPRGDIYIDTNTYILYHNIGGWSPFNNLLLMPLQLWPSIENIETPSGSVTRSAIPVGKLMKVGDYVFQFGPGTSNGNYDILYNPDTVQVEVDGGVWSYSTAISGDFQENNWFYARQRTVRLPLSTFDEARLMGFWFANPDGSFALSTNSDTASPTYRSIAVNDVVVNTNTLRIAGALGSMWGFGPPLDITLPPTGTYADVITGDIYLGGSKVVNLALNTIFLAKATTPNDAYGAQGDGFYNTATNTFYLKGASTWSAGTILNRQWEVNKRWGVYRNHAQFTINFMPHWDNDIHQYVNTIVIPSNDAVLPTIHRNYVSFWTEDLMAEQRDDLKSDWPGPWLQDASYLYAPGDMRIQSPYSFQPLGESMFASQYGFDRANWRPGMTYNAPKRFDAGMNLWDFYQPITSTYQDVLRKDVGIPEQRLGLLTNLTFGNQLIQLSDGNWYASVDLSRDLAWPYTGVAQNWAAVQHIQIPVKMEVTSGELVSRYLDERDPVSLQVQASCTYKTTFTLPSGFFPGMQSLSWENARGPLVIT